MGESKHKYPRVEVLYTEVNLLPEHEELIKQLQTLEPKVIKEIVLRVLETIKEKGAEEDRDNELFLLEEVSDRCTELQLDYGEE